MQGSISKNIPKPHFIMFLVDLAHDYRPHEEFSNFRGNGSSGCMNNPMYQKVHSTGCYEPQTGRNKRRYTQRARMKAARQQSNSYGKPRCKQTNGFV